MTRTPMPEPAYDLPENTVTDTAAASVTLSVLNGPAQGSAFTFDERATCVAGRAGECRPRLPKDDRYAARHHCLFDINPPDVRVRGFGGPHGTFVNGAEIGSRPHGRSGGTGPTGTGAERDLADGDEVRLGGTVLRVGITSAASPGPARCAHCEGHPPGPPGGRDGDIVCTGCRARPLPLVRDLLSRADAEDGLAGLRGYEVVRELGPGAPGSGVLYLARHRGTGALATLRVLLAEVAVGARARSGFLRATEYLRGLRHENIVGCRALGMHGAAFCLVGEHCPGGTLRQLLHARGGTLPPGEAVAIAVQILDALAYAHRGGRAAPADASRRAARSAPQDRVHGAIRPSGILLTGAGDQPAVPQGAAPPTVKIAGFGLARAFDLAGLSGLTRTGPLARAVAYLPRTQLTGAAGARPEEDVWATAATLYRMLTGTTPRDFPPAVDPVAVLLKEQAVPVRRRGTPVPRRLAQVVDAALIDSPRIVTTRADEFRRALLEAVG